MRRRHGADYAPFPLDLLDPAEPLVRFVDIGMIEPMLRAARWGYVDYLAARHAARHARYRSQKEG